MRRGPWEVVSQRPPGSQSQSTSACQLARVNREDKISIRLIMVKDQARLSDL